MSRFLVSGCSRGLGLEFVRQLIQGGHGVIATCRDPGNASQLKALVAQSDCAYLLQLDVGEEASIAALPAALKELGIEHVDVLVHNAGISAPTHPVDPTATATASSLRQCFNVNAVGPLILTQAMLPLLRGSPSAKTGSKVFFVSTNMGSIAQTTAGGSVSYRASKAALNMVGKCLAGEHGVGTADGLRITLCHPGWCVTDMGSAGDRSPPVTPQDSVAGMLRMIDGMGPHSKADFIDYTGAHIEW